MLSSTFAPKTMGSIVLVPAFFAIWYAIRRSLADAFILVYLSSVLLLPGWARWVLPHLPDPTFDEAAILPLVAIFVIKGNSKWQFSFLDLLISLLLLVMGISEYVNAGYADAQNMIFDMLASGVFPYALAKQLINTHALRIRFAKQFVLCLSIVFVTTLYEFKFAVNPFQLVFDRFFPGQSAGWVTTFRYGFPRVAGPYGHAISNGIITLIGLQFAFWLKDNRAWEPYFKWSAGKLRKSSAFVGAMLVEMVMTFTRGPQIGALLAYCLNWAGKGQDIKRRSLLLLSVFIFVGVPAIMWFDAYASVGRASALTQSQETAAYRKEMIDKYVDVAREKSWLGWGTSGWPKDPGMPSIDNYYLLLSLMHGFLATGLLLAILLTTIVRLYLNGLKNPPLAPPSRSLSFALAGIYAGLTFALAAVYMGLNVIPVFFLLTGFTECFLLHGGDKTLRAKSEVFAAKPKFHFQRIVA